MTTSMLQRETKLIIAEYCTSKFLGSRYNQHTCQHYTVIETDSFHKFLYKNDFPLRACEKARRLRPGNLNGIRDIILSNFKENQYIVLVEALFHKESKELQTLTTTQESLISDLKDAEKRHQDVAVWRRLFARRPSTIKRRIQDIEDQQKKILAGINRIKTQLHKDGYKVSAHSNSIKEPSALSSMD